MGNFVLAEMSMSDFLDEMLDSKLSIVVGFVSFVIFLRLIISACQDPVALNPLEWVDVKLTEKIYVTHNTRLLRFALSSPTSTLGLPVGQHVLVRAEIDGEEVFRPYVPITNDSEIGYFDIIIKIYEGGKLSNYLDSLEDGQYVSVRGPRGRLRYRGESRFVISLSADEERECVYTKVGLIAGGSGLTPCLQFIRAVLRNPLDQTRMSLIYANLTEEDIIMRDELEGESEAHANFDLWMTVDVPSETWHMGKGFINTDMIRARMPPPGPDTLILLCGPPPMMEIMTRMLSMMGYTRDMFFKF